MALFMEKGCSTCHNGIHVGGQAYFPFGVMKKPDPRVLPDADRRRFAITKAAADEYVFRAAPLRNVALSPLLPFGPGLDSEASCGPDE
ncbi:cytochrome c peroxidase [Bradyrhizobium sp. F1.13.1]